MDMKIPIYEQGQVATLIVAPALVVLLIGSGGFLLGVAYDDAATTPTRNTPTAAGPFVRAQSNDFVGGRGPPGGASGDGNFSVTGDYATVEDTIETFRLVVQGTTAWRHLPGDPARIELWLAVEPPDAPRRVLTTETVANETIPIDARRGREPFTLTADVLGASSWDAGHFEPPVGGKVERTLPVFLSVRVVWTDASGDELAVTGGGMDRLTVTVVHANRGEPGQTTNAKGTADVE